MAPWPLSKIIPPLGLGRICARLKGSREGYPYSGLSPVDIMLDFTRKCHQSNIAMEPMIRGMQFPIPPPPHAGEGLGVGASASDKLLKPRYHAIDF